MLVDNTLSPFSRTLEVLAVKTRRADYQGRVAASHAEGLAVYDEYHAQKVMHLLKEADVSVSANPQVSLGYEARLDQEPLRRGLTRVKQMWRMGINVFSSQDDVDDPWYPFGRNDQQEVAGYLCHTAQMTYPDEMEAAFDCVTDNAARALRLADYGVAPGCRADFNMLAAASVHQVLRLQQPPPYVVRGGRVLARNRLSREIARPC
jgi:cytosine deaminase